MYRKPNLVILGATKSASTLLQKCLDLHPDIYFTPGEVPYFESPDYEHKVKSHISSFFNGRNERYLGIKRPSYIGRPEVPERIKSDLPESKLLAVLRNPIERAISHYFHSMKNGFLPLLPLEAGMNKILEDNDYKCRHPHATAILEYGLYAKYLKKYNFFLNNGNIFILLQEDFIASKSNNMNLVLDFLGLPNYFEKEIEVGHPQKTSYSISSIRISRLFNLFYNKYNQSRTRLYPRKSTKTTQILKKIEGKITARFGNMCARDDRTISERLHQRLFDYYKSDIVETQEIIGKNLQKWLI